jgi:hypothetical protein
VREPRILDGLQQRPAQLHRVEGGRFVKLFRLFKVIVIADFVVVSVFVHFYRDDRLAVFADFVVLATFSFSVVASNVNVITLLKTFPYKLVLLRVVC